MIIPTYNPDQTDYEKSYLTKAYSAGATSVEVRSNERFAANDRIQIGALGAEKTEIVTVSAVGSDDITLTVGALQFSHNADDPVIVLQFDQVKIYRATSETGTYSNIATVALDVDNDTLQTIYDDTAGTSTNWYKVSFYHSVNAIESALSDPIPATGYERNRVGYIIDEVLQEVGDQAEQYISRGELIGYFNDVNDDLTSSASKPYDFLRTRTTLTRTANAITLNFPTDSNGDQSMWKFDRMDYNYTDTTTDPDTDLMSTIRIYPEEEFRNKYSDIEVTSTNVSDTKPEAMCLDTARQLFRYWAPSKTTTANVFYLYYWKYFTRLDSEGDEIETPTPRIYKLYSKAMYYRKRAATEPSYSTLADRYMADYVAEKARFKQIDRKDKGSPRSFRPVSSYTKDFRR